MSLIKPTRAGEPNELRQLRLARGLSQQALADLVGTSQSQIDRLERGNRRLTPEWVDKLNEALSNSKVTSLNPNYVAPNSVFNDRKKFAKPFNVDLNSVDPNRIPIYPTLPHQNAPMAFYLATVSVGSIPRPKALGHDPDLFALHVPTHSMSPRWAVGEIALVTTDFITEPPPETGPCLIRLASEHYGEGAFCFAQILGTRSRFRSELPEAVPGRITLSFLGVTDFGTEWMFLLPGSYTAIHRVIDWPELLGEP